MNKIPTIEFFLRAYKILFDNLAFLVKLIFFPFILVFVVGYLTSRSDIKLLSDERMISSLFNFFFYLLMIPVVTAWHRCILVYEDAKPYYWFGKKEALYIKALLILAAAWLVTWLLVTVLLLPMVTYLFAAIFPWEGEESIRITTYVSTLIWWLYYGLITFVVAKFFLILPAAAIGKRMDVAESSVATQGNTIRLVAVYFISYVPFLASDKYLIVSIEKRFFDYCVNTNLQSVFWLSAALVVEFMFYAITVAVLSQTYEYLIGVREDKLSRGNSNERHVDQSSDA